MPHRPSRPKKPRNIRRFLPPPSRPASPPARAVAAADQPAKATKLLSARQLVAQAIASGVVPNPPDFSAKTHARFRSKLADLVALVERGDIKRLRAYQINPISSSPRALAKYRDHAVAALGARAKAAAKTAAKTA